MRKKKFICYKGSDEGVQVRRSIPLKESPQKIEVEMSVSIHSPAEDLLSGVPLFKADLIKIIEVEEKKNQDLWRSVLWNMRTISSKV